MKARVRDATLTLQLNELRQVNEIREMTKARFYHVIAARSGKTYDDVCAVMDAMSELAQETLAAQGEVRLPRIGKLYSIKTPQRLGRNPRTGEPVLVQEGYAVRFRASSELKGKSAA